MHDYNQYVTAINKIFDYVAKLKAGWDNQDNLSYIEKIEGFQNMVTGSANEFKKPPTHPVEDDEEEDNSNSVQEEKKSIPNAFAPNPEPEEKIEITPPQVASDPVEESAELEEETPVKEEQPQPEETPAPPQTEVPSSPIPQVVASEPAPEEKETSPPQQSQEPSSPIPKVVNAEAPPMPEAPKEDNMGLAEETGATTVVAN